MRITKCWKIILNYVQNVKREGCDLTIKLGAMERSKNPFQKLVGTRRYECDNCGHVEFRNNTTENVRIGENLNISVEKADKNEF